MGKETEISIGEKLLEQLLALAYLLGKYCYGIEIDDSNGGDNKEYIAERHSVLEPSL